MRATRRGFVLGALACCASRAIAADDDAWQHLRRGGLVIFMREAPAEQASRVGARLRDERVPIERVYTSPSPECTGTAMLAFGSAEEWDPLALVGSAQIDDENTEHVRKRIASYTQRKLHGNVAMVTHAANIASLTKRDAAPGELVIVRPDGCCGLRVVEQLKVA